MAKDPYTVLGVSKTASAEELKKIIDAAEAAVRPMG